MLEAVWFWGALALLVFWSLGAYNRLVRLRAQVAQRFAELQKALLRYQDLVQDAVTAAASDPEHWRSTATLANIASHWGRLPGQQRSTQCGYYRRSRHLWPALGTKCGWWKRLVNPGGTRVPHRHGISAGTYPIPGGIELQ